MIISRILTLGALLLALPCAAIAAEPKVTIRTELASPVILENTQDRNYLKISLVGYPRPLEKRSPINLALVIDRSSSMSGDRIERARDAAILAVNMLDSNDTLSVVTYDSGVDVIVPATKVRDKQQIISAIRNNTGPRGMTALFAGVSKGINQVDKFLDKEQINRIILLSDGQANVGPTATSEMAELARMAARKGIAITTLGIGTHYNEDLMTTLAGYSDGNHAFIENASDLEKAFVKEFDDVMSVVAQDVEVIIKTADQVKPVRLLGRDGTIKGNTITVKLNQLYANQEKYVLLEVLPAQGKNRQSKPLADVAVSYNNLATQKTDTHREQLAVRYSSSRDEVAKAVVEDVMVESAIQQMALESEQAIELMDQGRFEEAKSRLEQSAAALQSMPVTSEAAQSKIQSTVETNSALQDRMDTDKEGFRKALKEENFRLQNQSKGAQ